MSSGIGPKLELRQGQQLVMTQQLQQSIKLLQMSSVELAEFLAVEVERNPLLMLEESDEAKDAANRDEERNQPNTEVDNDAGDDYAGSSDDAFAIAGESSQASDWLDADDKEFWGGEASEGEGSNPWDNGDQLSYSGSRGGDDDDDAGSVLEQTLKNETSLQDHVFQQMQHSIQDPAQRVIAARLIEQLDEAGYLQANLVEIADQLGCDVADVEAVLVILQGFEPTGIFARNLSECLALQLREKDRLDPAMKMLVENLEMLAAGKLDALKRKCGVDAEDFAEMVTELKSLNPKPGTGFARDDSQMVIPDVLLRKGKDGQWVVELNAHTLPRLLVNRRYLAQLQTSVTNQVAGGKANAHVKEDRKYLADQLATANWLVKALDQRAQSLLKVATEIVAQQQGFFRYGVTHLKPMTLKDIADNVGVHESTVSRVTTNKFIGSTRGLFELKYFFTSSLSSDDGDGDISSKAVQHYIREMVDGETAAKILSDDAIAEALQLRGINVARRTVAKYRDILKIPSSAERRRSKKMVG